MKWIYLHQCYNVRYDTFERLVYYGTMLQSSMPTWLFVVNPKWMGLFLSHSAPSSTWAGFGHLLLWSTGSTWFQHLVFGLPLSSLLPQGFPPDFFRFDPFSLLIYKGLNIHAPLRIFKVSLTWINYILNTVVIHLKLVILYS